ncbi:MAG: hypothetical protein PSV35_10340, partial [bacterium]|nr:hypothetical protein [bacterium]
MSICTSILSKKHHLTTKNTLKEAKNLAFKELLPKAETAPLMKGEKLRERIYTPEVTLWAFLSQAIEEDKSQQAAVSRVVASAIANGELVPSINTSAFSQARSNLNEECISLLAKNTAQEVVEQLPKDLIQFQTMAHHEIQRRQDEDYAQIPELTVPPFHFSVKVNDMGVPRLDSKELADVLSKMTEETLSGLLNQASASLKKKQY